MYLDLRFFIFELENYGKYVLPHAQKNKSNAYTLTSCHVLVQRKGNHYISLWNPMIHSNDDQIVHVLFLPIKFADSQQSPILEQNFFSQIEE